MMTMVMVMIMMMILKNKVMMMMMITVINKNGYNTTDHHTPINSTPNGSPPTSHNIVPIKVHFT